MKRKREGIHKFFYVLAETSQKILQNGPKWMANFGPFCRKFFAVFSEKIIEKKGLGREDALVKKNTLRSRAKQKKKKNCPEGPQHFFPFFQINFDHFLPMV